VPKKVLTAALAACLFALIVGAKWATFDRFGSPMPDWDQWDAEASELLIPWFENDQFTAHLFHPHNEHRIILTKLQNLALTLLNGQWDSRLEAVTNAVLHAALAVAFWLLGRRITAPRWHAPLFLLAFLLFGLPVAWQNVLGGFHSQQYWLLGLSFLALAWLPLSRAGRADWWSGLAAATLVLGSMGSGLVAAATAMVIVALRCWRREISLRDGAPTLALGGGLVLFGLLTRGIAEHHAALKAQSLSDFVFTALHSLQWPLRHADWAAPIMWAPWTLLAWAHVRRSSTPLRRGGWLVVGLGLWTLVQIAATAYARGVGADYPAPRYQDTLVFGAMANAIALAWLFSASSLTLRARRGLQTLALLWIAGLGFGLYQNLAQAFSWDLPEAKRYYLAAEANVRRYLVTGDIAELDSPDISYPSIEGLTDRLDHPIVRALLPMPLRTPLPMVRAATPSGGNPGAFLENDLPPRREIWPLQHGLSFDTPALDGARTWGSYSQGGAAATGEWRSEPIAPSPHAWLKFETAGHVGEPGVALELRDARTDAVLASIRPTRVPRDSWRAAYVRTPAVPFVVVARDTDPQRWLAFSPPVEMAALSHAAWRVTRHGLLIVWVALLTSLVLGGAAWLQARRAPGG